jgi:hypothetical protein
MKTQPFNSPHRQAARGPSPSRDHQHQDAHDQYKRTQNIVSKTCNSSGPCVDFYSDVIDITFIHFIRFSIALVHLHFSHYEYPNLS